jgi:hypothetical protein
MEDMWLDLLVGLHTLFYLAESLILQCQPASTAPRCMELLKQSQDLLNPFSERGVFGLERNEKTPQKLIFFMLSL